MGRFLDAVLAGFYLMFVIVSATVEAPTCLGYEVRPDSPLPMLRMSYDWCVVADRLFIAMPVWVRGATCMHAFFFGPCYMLFAMALLLRWNAIRVPALMVNCAKIAVGFQYMFGNLLDEAHSPGNPWLFVLQSSSYMVIPAMMIVRMLPEKPFGEHVRVAAPATRAKKHQ